MTDSRSGSAEPTGEQRSTVLPRELFDQIQLTLEGFEKLSLTEIAQRVVRVARQRGDVEVALRFALELRPLGGDTRWSGTEMRNLMTGIPKDKREQLREKIHLGWERDRIPTSIGKPASAVGGNERVVLSGSIAQIESRMALQEREMDRATVPHIRKFYADHLFDQREILTRIRHRAFMYFSECEASMAHGAVGLRVFEAHRARVDSLLDRIAPDIREQFVSAERALRRQDPEGLAHALTTCRRLLVAVADLVYPARETPAADRSGTVRPVGRDQYINRLVMSYALAVERGAGPDLVLVTVEQFAQRVRRLNDLLAKGVHASVTVKEAELAILHSYLLAGEVLDAYRHAEGGSRP